MRSPRKNIRVREKMLESEKIFLIPIGVRRSLSELRWTSLDSVGTPLDSVGTVKLSDVILYFSESMNCEEYLEIVRWSPLDIRWSPTESDGRPSESVGYPTEFRRTQNKLNNFGISESDRSRQASDRSPSDLKMNLKNGKRLKNESDGLISESVGVQ